MSHIHVRMSTFTEQRRLFIHFGAVTSLEVTNISRQNITKTIWEPQKAKGNKKKESMWNIQCPNLNILMCSRKWRKCHISATKRLCGCMEDVGWVWPTVHVVAAGKGLWNSWHNLCIPTSKWFPNTFSLDLHIWSNLQSLSSIV